LDAGGISQFAPRPAYGSEIPNVDAIVDRESGEDRRAHYARRTAPYGLQWSVFSYRKRGITVALSAVSLRLEA
jgi:hypothetical protein